MHTPVADETLGVLNSSANSLLKETGNKISLNTAESREVSFLHKWRFNVILLQWRTRGVRTHCQENTYFWYVIYQCYRSTRKT